MSKIIGIIPARWASTRLPGKSLVPICGKPLVQWVYERAKQARLLDQLLIATDDERIADAANRFGAGVVMTRHDHISGTDRIAEAIRDMEATVVINIQGDEPLIDPALIDQLGQTLNDDTSWNMATAAAPITNAKELENPAVVKVVSGREGQALYFSRAVIPHVRDSKATLHDLHWRHIGIYAYQRSFLEEFVATPPCAIEEAEKLEQLRALHLGARIKVIPVKEAGIGVDTPADVAKVKAALKKAGLA